MSKITYKVTSLGKETQSETFDFDDTKPTQIHEFVIPVNPMLNNNDDVKITVTATDNAGNTSEKSLDIQIDNTAPVVSVTNLESGKSYNQSSMDVIIKATDNMDIKSAVIYIDDKIYHEWTDEEIEKITANNDDFKFTINDFVKTPRTMKAVFTDQAENETTVIITDFTIVKIATNLPDTGDSSSLPLMIVIMSISLVLIVFLIVKKLKK